MACGGRCLSEKFIGVSETTYFFPIWIGMFFFLKNMSTRHVFMSLKHGFHPPPPPSPSLIHDHISEIAKW